MPNVIATYPPNYFFGVTEKGWIDTATFYGWVANHFLSNISEIRPVLLLVDGHATHIDVHTAQLCKENNVVLYLLHSHASHLIQPYDREYFKTFKQIWGDECSRFRNCNPGKAINKGTFAEVFVPAYDKTVNRHIIVSSFKNSGIWPINPDVIDFSSCQPAKVIFSKFYFSPFVAAIPSILIWAPLINFSLKIVPILPTLQEQVKITE